MRKAKPKKRIILPDPVFGDVRVTKFVNHLMYDGKKNSAFTIFYDALQTVKSKLPNEELEALDIWKKALENVTPTVEVKSRRIGGATFQVPTEIRPDRKESISMKKSKFSTHVAVAVRPWPTSSPQKSWTHSTSRARIQAQRGYAQDGRGQPRIRTLPFLIR